MSRSRTKPIVLHSVLIAVGVMAAFGSQLSATLDQQSAPTMRALETTPSPEALQRVVREHRDAKVAEQRS